MSAIGYWAGIGIVCALIAIGLTRDRGRGTVVNLGLGVVGAVAGGLAFNILMSAPNLGYSPYAMITAAAVSVIVLAGYHGVAGRRPI